uniref:EF-hand domain-containing protein n=1 Tax=Timema tahoe TaxID=61484 RepID=A0A7R9IPX4_9NEOP|nr:unnamed protein product [Timema tahoe]
MSYQDLSYAGQPLPGSYSAGGYQPGTQQPMSIYPGGQQPVDQGTIDPKIQQWFSTVDSDHSGVISAKELQAALVNGQGKHFSDTACRLMIGMFDEDQTGTINLLEFQLLFNYINQWLGTFKSYDQDGSGHIEEKELSQAGCKTSKIGEWRNLAECTRTKCEYRTDTKVTGKRIFSNHEPGEDDVADLFRISLQASDVADQSIIENSKYDTRNRWLERRDQPETFTLDYPRIWPSVEMDLRYHIVKLQNSSPYLTDGANCSISSGDDILGQWTL